MTRTALTLELLAVLALACERREGGARHEPEGDAVESVEPELTNGELEQELDRIEHEIKTGKKYAGEASGLPEPAKAPEKATAEPSKARGAPRNKSTNSRNRAEDKRTQRSGTGSS